MSPISIIDSDHVFTFIELIGVPAVRVRGIAVRGERWREPIRASLLADCSGLAAVARAPSPGRYVVHNTLPWPGVTRSASLPRKRISPAASKQRARALATLGRSEERRVGKEG